MSEVIIIWFAGPLNAYLVREDAPSSYYVDSFQRRPVALILLGSLFKIPHKTQIRWGYDFIISHLLFTYFIVYFLL